MCGIFGIVGGPEKDPEDLKHLAKYAEQRGRDSSGLVFFREGTYEIRRADQRVSRFLGEVEPQLNPMVMGHSRLITNGLGDNQPVVYEGICAIHNGIVVNHADLWSDLDLPRKLEIDSEIIPALAHACLAEGLPVEEAASQVLDRCRGVVACAMVVPEQGKLVLFSNNGSMYIGRKGEARYFEF